MATISCKNAIGQKHVCRNITGGAETLKRLHPCIYMHMSTAQHEDVGHTFTLWTQAPGPASCAIFHLISLPLLTRPEYTALIIVPRVCMLGHAHQTSLQTCMHRQLDVIHGS